MRRLLLAFSAAAFLSGFGFVPAFAEDKCDCTAPGDACGYEEPKVEDHTITFTVDAFCALVVYSVGADFSSIKIQDGRGSIAFPKDYGDPTVKISSCSKCKVSTRTPDLGGVNANVKPVGREGDLDGVGDKVKEIAQ